MDFLVYSIKEGGGRLGADFCRLLPKEGATAGAASRASSAGAIPGVGKLSPLAKVRGSVGTTSSKLMAAAAAKLKSVAKEGSKDSDQAKGAKGAKGSSKGSEAPRQVIMKAAPKSKGSKTSQVGPQGVQKTHLKFVKSTKKAHEDGKGHGKGGHGSFGDKERTVVAHIPRLGTITKWRGNYGWIEADKAVDHPQAARNHGRIFLHIKDFEGEAVKEGIRVTWLCFCVCFFLEGACILYTYIKIYPSYIYIFICPPVCVICSEKNAYVCACTVCSCVLIASPF